MTPSEVLELQRALNGSGLAYAVLGEPLEEDGIYGKNTVKVHRWHLDHDTSIPTITPEPDKPWWQSRAIVGLLAAVLAGAAQAMGLEIGSEEITAILLPLAEFVGLVLAMWGTVRRKGAIDPTLVMRLPRGRDVRLPVRAERQPPRGPGRSDPRGHFSTD
jgi:hypothetical protein